MCLSVCCELLANHGLYVTVPVQLSSRAYSVVPPPRDSEEKEMLDRILRVDHAGEYGANCIYAGQMAVLGRSRTGPLIQVRTELWSRAEACQLASLCTWFIKCVTVL